MQILREKTTNIVVTAMTTSEIKDSGSICCDGVIYTDCTLENFEIIDGIEVPMKFVNGCYTYADGEWTCTFQKAVDAVFPSDEQLLTDKLNEFAGEKDIDGIGEASALLNSTNAQWVAEARKFVNLWDASWQAFYGGGELPVLSWT
jgi:hypothetical protein